jgi:hypothetical protein
VHQEIFHGACPQRCLARGRCGAPEGRPACPGKVYLARPRPAGTGKKAKSPCALWQQAGLTPASAWRASFATSSGRHRGLPAGGDLRPGGRSGYNGLAAGIFAPWARAAQATQADGPVPAETSARARPSSPTAAKRPDDSAFSLAGRGRPGLQALTERSNNRTSLDSARQRRCETPTVHPQHARLTSA